MQEELVLHSPGAIPGIPGEHGPGVYLVDYDERTIKPKEASAAPATEVLDQKQEAAPEEAQQPIVAEPVSSVPAD